MPATLETVVLPDGNPKANIRFAFALRCGHRAPPTVREVMRRTAPRRPRRLRTRVRNAIAVVAALSLLLFGVPLAVVLDRLITSQALAGLQRDATRGVAAVPDNVLEAGQRLTVPTARSGNALGVYDVSGGRLGGAGPATSALAAAVADGREHDGRDGADLAVVVPVLSDTTVAGSVRAAVPRQTLRAHVHRAWALLGALALAVVGVSWLLAGRAARRVSEPFEELTRAARDLGAGQFQLALPRWGVMEADAAGRALQDAAGQIDRLVTHERAFMRDASHQLRTPLAALVVHLEQDPPDVPAAVASARHLGLTIADLVALRSTRVGGRCDAAAVAADAVRRWAGPTAAVVLRRDDVPAVNVSEQALRQALDVLLDNALRHGAAPVTVTVEAYGQAVLVEVADSGAGFDGSPPGTGLGLATRLVEHAGGSLLMRERGPGPRVALLLPVADGGVEPAA